MLPVVTDAQGQTPRPRWGRGDVIALVFIVIVGAFLRFADLGDPATIMFDEVHYVKDACWYVEGDARLCETDHDLNYVHPPLGKWLLGFGIGIFGHDAFGWRFMAAMAGSLTILVLFLLARRLLRSTIAASLAAGLLAVDFLHFVQSRIAMLDIFVPMFGMAAILFAVYDRDRLIDGRAQRRGLLRRPWRFAAGAAAGAALASKWSGVFFVILVIVLTVVSEIAARRGGDKGWFRRGLREEGPSVVLALVILPLIVYVAAYVGRFDAPMLAMPWTQGSFWRSIWDQQFVMLDWHTRGIGSQLHPYASPPWSWPLLKRPVSYFFETTPSGEYMEVVAIGSPLVWWASLVALVYTAISWFRDRRLGNAAGLIAGGFLINYVPWVIQQTEREAVFLFYLLPSVPFMCLALGFVAARVARAAEGKIAVGAFAAAAVVFFVFFYPVLAKVAIPQEQWDQRIRFRDCNSTQEGGPPEGWCWI
jgi:dolichyl-phosphate-mannose-protein mannosyltransferase